MDRGAQLEALSEGRPIRRESRVRRARRDLEIFPKTFRVCVSWACTSRAYTSRACISWGYISWVCILQACMYLTGLHLMDVHLTGVYLIGVHLIDERIPHLRVFLARRTRVARILVSTPRMV